MQLLFKAVGMLAEIYISKFLYKRIRWLDSIMNSTDMDLSKLQEIVKDRGAWRGTVHGVSKSWTGLSN